MAESQDGTLCSTKNEQLVTTHNNMGESHRLNTQRRRQPVDSMGSTEMGRPNLKAWDSTSFDGGGSD